MAASCNYDQKVHWVAKLGAFAGSVLSLSWFFAGWRQVHEAPTAANWLLLATGVLVTAFLVTLQGYWIYFDEKAKGSLRKRIDFYERIHNALNAKAKAAACCADEGMSDTDG
jgi:thiosulfate reductase cytochrome b subunit